MSGHLCEGLREAGHDALWAGDWNPDPGDQEILDRAHEQARVLVTLDKDFGEIAIVKGRPHSGIVRLAGLALNIQLHALLRIAANFEGVLARGGIVTVEPGRVRVRSIDE